MSKRILVPITHSEEAERALDFALSNFPDGDITVIHVFNPAVHYAGEGYIDERMLRGEQEKGEQLLETAKETAADRGISISTELEKGNTRKVIVDYAEENGFDQIVMGSRGRSGISRMLLGSVAETVVRRAQIPVTIVK